MSNELIQKSSSSTILDKFRALLREREDELKITDDDIVAPPSPGEIARLYEVLLSELTFNSKPLITDLTILAGEQRQHSEGIADVICARIIEAPVDQKLPSLYLLDSIVKNIGKEYVRHFSACLPEVFCEAYKQIDPNLYPAMRHLFRTWSTVFPSSVLRKIEGELHFSPHANRQSPRPPTHGIHVNPKYLEARHQFEHSTGDRDSRGPSPNLRTYAQKTPNGYGKYESDRSEVSSSVVGQQMNSSGSTRRTSLASSADKPFPSNVKFARPSSPPRASFPRSLSPLVNDLSSPRKVLDGASSPSHSVSDFGVTRVTNVDEETNELQRRHRVDDNGHRFDVPLYNHNNQRDLQGPRALIDAYGNDNGKKSVNVEPLDANSIGCKVAMRTWKSTEEEEYDWEDMSPTLRVRGQSSDLSSSRVPPSLSLSSQSLARPGMTSKIELDLRSSHRSAQSQLPFDEDPFKMPGSSHASLKLPGALSRQPQEAWNMSKHLLQPPQYDPEGKGFPLNTSRSGTSSSDLDAQAPWSLLHSSSFGSADFEPVGVPYSMGLRPPMVKSYGPLSLPVLPSKEMRSQLNFPTVVNHGQHKPPYFPEQRLDGLENRAMNAHKLRILPDLVGGHPNRQIMSPPLQPHLVAPPFVHGFISQGHGAPMSDARSSLAIQNIHNSSLPPLPPGPPPGNVLPGLIGSLMAQGLISLTPQPTAQASVGIDFNPDILRIRHESVILALYYDLPRQCKTCGLRFKTQEEHSTHMDWHVTKNRISKNRKQKASRKWFVSTGMWLSTAETLGTEAVPGFLPAETVSEEKNDDGDELAVPAEEDQNACALCGEPFEDFYCDESDQWMYRGAVYMNAPGGVVQGLERADLGSIVHAKCRSESTVVPPEDFVPDEGGSSEEGRERKRMRR